MHAVAVLLFHLLHGTNSPAQLGELGQFLLNGLQPFMPLTVRHLGLDFIPALTPVFIVHFLKVSDLFTEPPDLFPKHCQMIHRYSIAHLERSAALSHTIEVKHGSPRLFCVESVLGLS